jgi:SNF2 family DNA or RNA helicase
MFKTPPRPHQAEDFERAKDEAAWGHFWGVGAGKSWMGVNQAALLYRKGEIDAMLVVAPSSVHEMWISEQIAEHMPDDIPWTGHIYFSSRARTKKFQRELKAMFKEKFPILVITYPACRTSRGKNDKRGTVVGKDLVMKFLKERKVFFCADESQFMKTPGAKITKMLTAASRYAKHKRIFSGTSITNSPFDIYSQLRFLDGSFWPRKGFGSYQSFKTTFGEFEEMRLADRRFQRLKGYKNLDYLREIIKDISDHHTTEEVLDLPERTFTKRFFDPSPEQRRMYKDLQRDFYTFLDEQDDLITTQLVITRLVRFQQLLSGFIETDEGGFQRLSSNPRLALLEDILENEIPGKKAIIWAKFKEDISQICGKMGDAAVRFDGSVKETDRLEARMRFKKDPKCLYFVANPAAGGTGLTLNEANVTIYYNNSFNLAQRLQSEGRNHRMGQTGTVLVIDLLARGLGIDWHILQRLREKREMIDTVFGHEVREWI